VSKSLLSVNVYLLSESVCMLGGIGCAYKLRMCEGVLVE
jgi:hypothetical protein